MLDAAPEEPEPEPDAWAPAVEAAVGVADEAGYAAPTGLISNSADCAQIYEEASKIRQR